MAGKERRGDVVNETRHWLVRPRTIRRLWVGFGVVLALTLLADAAVTRHPHFPIEGVFGFYAWYGFGTCVAMVLLSKVAGWVLKREDTYYGD